MFTNLPLELREEAVLDLGKARVVLSAFTICGDAVIVINQDLNVLAMNTEAEALYGLVDVDYEGHNLLKLADISIHPDECAMGTTIARRRGRQHTASGREMEVEFSMISLDSLGIAGLRAIIIRDRTTVALALDEIFKKPAATVPLVKGDMVGSLD